MGGVLVVAISVMGLGLWWLGGGSDPCPGGEVPDEYTPLQAAAVQEDLELIGETIRITGDADGADCTGFTALMEAVRNHNKSVPALLEGGADVNRADESGATALDVALIRGDEWSATFLLDHGATVDHTMERGIFEAENVTPCEIGRESLPDETELLRRLCN